MSTQILNEDQIIDIIHKIIFKTIGCTEPVAIALAAVVAYKEIGGNVKSVNISLDKNVYKNAMAVGVPGTDQKGPKMAVALGLVCGDPSKGLLLLQNATEQDVKEAKKMLEENLIQVVLNNDATSLCIQAEIETDQGFAKAIIEQRHDNIILIEKNGEIIYHRIAEPQTKKCFLGEYNFADLDLINLIETIKNISPDRLFFLQEGYAINLQTAEVGIEKNAGMQLGATYKNLIQEGILGDNFINKIKMLVAGASDARMGGIKIPVCGCAGSGNHGIAFFLTTGHCFKHFNVTQNLQLQAYALGLIIMAAIKQSLGLLSSVCGGAIAVGAAAAASITYALNGNMQQIISAINLIIGNISGIVCDGAKCGCALKIVTGAEFAVDAALLALKNVSVPISDGIIGRSFNETIANLGLLNKCGMAKVEEVVLEVLKNKCV